MSLLFNYTCNTFCLSAIVVLGYVLISAVTAVTTLSLEQYALAGSLAGEVLSRIRTVAALNAQPVAIQSYREHLFAAMKV